MATLNVHLCEHCGKDFVPLRKRDFPIRFCSRSCRAQARKQLYHCLECNKPFYSLTTRGKFCSKPCRLLFARKEKETNRIPEPCPVCGIDLFHGRMRSHPEFCSKGCYYQSTYVNRICLRCSQPFRLQRSGGWKKQKDYCSQSCKLDVHCELCYTPVYGRNRINGKPVRFCSRECAALRATLIKSKVKYKILGYVATLERLGKIACEECDIEDMLVLNVHHKDHSHANNTRENLQTLCSNCHVRKHRADSKRGAEDLDTALRLFEVMKNRKKHDNQLTLF